MGKITENKIWRVVARIDDEIIIKQASSVEKATRSTRNAVCQRLCDSAGIEYELGWWKGSRHKARRDFVDNFIGTPLYVQIDDEVEVDLHEVPYEVYTIQQVRLTFRKMTLMTPDNIDAWGFLHWGPGEDEKMQLLGQKLPIPPHLSSTKGYEEEQKLPDEHRQAPSERIGTVTSVGHRDSDSNQNRVEERPPIMGGRDRFSKLKRFYTLTRNRSSLPGSAVRANHGSEFDHR